MLQPTMLPKLVQRNLCYNESRDHGGQHWEHSPHAYLRCENTVVINTPNAPCMLLFYITKCLPDMKQGMHLIITMPLIPLQLRIKIFTHMSCPRMTGNQLTWCPHGSSPFAVWPHRCPPPSRCYLQHMLSFRVSRRISRGSYTVFLLLFLPILSVASLMCMWNLVIIIISMMNHHSILGQHVHCSSHYNAVLLTLW